MLGKTVAPWLIAAWPGMGTVAVIAAGYLVRELDMKEVAELPGRDVVQHGPEPLLGFHRVGERWAKATGSGEAGGVAGQLLPLIGMFRLNRKHLDIQFKDSSRWEARFGYPEQTR